MFCKNCGQEVQPGSNICTKCGVPLGQGNRYCPRCGVQTDELAVVCVKCGTQLKPIATGPQTVYGPNGIPYQPKSKFVAGLLGVLVGSLGVHNFYLGFTNKGITQLLLCTVGSLACGLGPIAAFIWGLVEGVQIFTGTIHQDSNGNELAE